MANTVSLQKEYSALNEALVKLFDEAGVRRSFTIPYIEGQEMGEHVAAVGQVASQSGGLTSNLIMSAHHSGGKGWGSGEGHTVGHPADKLRTTVIRRDDPNAKAAINACQKYLDDLEFLLGKKEPTVITANSQLNLVKKFDGAGMNLYDFGVMLIQITHPPTQAAARAHSGTKQGGHGPHLRAPEKASQPEQEQPQEAQGDPQAAGQAPEGQESVPAPQGAPQEAAPAPQAQG